VLVADSRGLREAGCTACPRVNPEHPADLVAWLRLFLDPISLDYFSHHLERRRMQRLSGINPDLLGLALAAMARQTWTS